MGLFKADLFRSFGVGFVLGVIGLAAVMGGGESAGTSFMPHAVAAPARD